MGGAGSSLPALRALRAAAAEGVLSPLAAQTTAAQAQE